MYRFEKCEPTVADLGGYRGSCPHPPLPTFEHDLHVNAYIHDPCYFQLMPILRATMATLGDLPLRKQRKINFYTTVFKRS